MKLSEVMDVRDLSIRNSILAAVPVQERDRLVSVLDDAFLDGDQVFREHHLNTLKNGNGARLRSLLDRAVVSAEGEIFVPPAP